MLYDPGDILYASSRDGKTYLRTAAEEAITSLTLQELEMRLVGRGFFKAHRAYLVNLQHIKAVIQYTRNSYTLQLNDEQRTQVKQILGDARGQLEALRKESEPKVGQIRQQADERLQKVLTPAQWQQFQQLRAELRARRHRHDERGNDQHPTEPSTNNFTP